MTAIVANTPRHPRIITCAYLHFREVITHAQAHISYRLSRSSIGYRKLRVAGALIGTTDSHRRHCIFCHGRRKDSSRS